MEDQYTSPISEEERAQRRARRAASRKKRQRQRRRQLLRRIAPLALLSIVLISGLSAWASSRHDDPSTLKKAEPVFVSQRPEPPAVTLPPYAEAVTEHTVTLGEDFSSEFAILIQRSTGQVLAAKNATSRISPASMVKILTLLVASEHITDLKDTFTMTREITDYCFVNHCSVVGIDVDETVTVEELLYGCILCSGADATLGLATYVAGSPEEFVKLMNAKAQELGIDGSAHFTNPVGVYDPELYCSVYDMAVILNAAMDSPLCREVLTARTFETAPTKQHPEGQILSNWFLRKGEDHVPEGFELLGAKTGFVVQSGNCAASFGANAQGEEFLCVTGNTFSLWRAIRDHLDLYGAHCMK